MDCLKQQYSKQGFAQVAQFFEESKIARLEQVVANLFLMQANKIGEYRTFVQSLIKDDTVTSFMKLSAIYEEMEVDDKEALYQVQHYLPSSQAVRDIFDDRFMSICAGLLGVPDSDSLLLHGPGLFVNRPNTQRLQYKWHSESHYYPKRRNLLNIWLPIFGNKSKSNGTMSFKIGSHQATFPFSEYSGFNKDTQNNANHFLQYEIPECLLTEYEEHFILSNRRDLVIFDQNLVHRSNNNPSDSYSMAVVARVWEPSNDLTISGSMNVKSYGGDIGRPNLIVD
jgi:hypothetical protein